MKKLIKVALVASLLSSTALAGDYKIGVLAPISGGMAAVGEESVNGVKLALKHLAAAGELGGHTFEVVVGDVGNFTPGEVSSAAERLLGTDDLHLIVTAQASTTNFEIELMKDNDMPYLVGANSVQTNGIIGNNGKDFPTVFSLVPLYDGYVDDVMPTIKYIGDSGKFDLPNKKIAIITSDNPYSKTIASGVRDKAKGIGWTVTEYEVLPMGEINDWRPFLNKVRKNPPAVILNADYQTSNAVKFTEQFLEKPTDSLIFIQYAPSVPEYVELAGKKSEGIMTTMISGPLEASPRTPMIKKAYEKEFGKVSGSYGLFLYEAIGLYVDAVKKVGDPSKRLEIAKAIGQTDKKIAQGRIVFDPKTKIAKSGNDFMPTVVYQLQNGKPLVFAPKQWKEVDFKTPPWAK